MAAAVQADEDVPSAYAQPAKSWCLIRVDLEVLAVFQHRSVDDIPKGARYYRGRMRCGIRPVGSLLTRKGGIGVAVAFDAFWRLQRQVGLFLLSNVGCLGLSWGLIWVVHPRCRTWCTLSPCTQP